MRFRVSGQQLRNTKGVRYNAKPFSGTQGFGNAQCCCTGIEKKRVSILNMLERLCGDGTFLHIECVCAFCRDIFLCGLCRNRNRAARNPDKTFFCRHRIQIGTDGRLRCVQKLTQLRDRHLSVLRQKLQYFISADVNFQSACCHRLHVLFIGLYD